MKPKHIGATTVWEAVRSGQNHLPRRWECVCGQNYFSNDSQPRTHVFRASQVPREWLPGDLLMPASHICCSCQSLEAASLPAWHTLSSTSGTVPAPRRDTSGTCWEGSQFPGMLFRPRADHFPWHSGVKAAYVFTLFNRLKDYNHWQAAWRAENRPLQLNSFFSQGTNRAGEKVPYSSIQTVFHVDPGLKTWPPH